MVRSLADATIHRRIVCGLCALALQVVITPPLHADPAVVRGADGIQGSLTDLGEGVLLYRTPHGALEPIGAGPEGNQRVPGGGPQDPVQPGSRTPFGTPPPPSGLTPAPILPFTPHGTVIPQPSAPPQLPAPGSGSRGSGYRGR